MSKQKAKGQSKKRTKRYTGEDAAQRGGTKVTRVSVEKKSWLATFWQENKLKILSRVVQIILAGLVFILLRALISWIF